jgi:hypothetical protein
MSKSLLQTRIVDKLEVIMTQVDTMNKFGKNIPLIHLDILKSNIRMLYEQICELERTQMQSTSSQRTVNSLFREAETPVVTKHEEERIVAEATETISRLVESIQEEVANEYAPEVKLELEPILPTPIATVEIPTIETPIAENQTVETSIVETSTVEEAPLLQVETTFNSAELVSTAEETVFTKETEEDEESLISSPIPDIFSSLQTIVDRYKTPDSSLNEAMAISNVSVVNTAMKQVRDLKSSIGINEKFLFINELFKGNMKEYTDTIVMLSDAETLDFANEILRPLKDKYEWREDSAAYVTLIDFLQRRFV